MFENIKKQRLKWLKKPNFGQKLHFKTEEKYLKTQK